MVYSKLSYNVSGIGPNWVNYHVGLLFPRCYVGDNLI